MNNEELKNKIRKEEKEISLLNMAYFLTEYIYIYTYTGWPEKKLVKVNSYNSKNTKRRTMNEKSHERIQLQVLFGINVTSVLYIFHSLTSFF